MCGIFTLLNNVDTFSDNFVTEQFNKGKQRGPEYSSLSQVSMKALFGFHRLAINGLTSTSNQPIVIDNVALICNGEIYNYKQLYELMKLPKEKIVTESDCEVIIHLYIRYGMEQTLKMLDGVFALVLCDLRIQQDNTENHIYVARDPIGVRPLYMLKRTNNLSISTPVTPIKKYFSLNDNRYNHQQNIIGFASELKSLSKFTEGKYENMYQVSQFTPGTYSKYTLGSQSITEWEPCQDEVSKSYFVPSPPSFYDFGLKLAFTNPYISREHSYEEFYHKRIRELLVNSVKKRCISTERPIACLLSGGLDSSLITALVNDWRKTSICESYITSKKNMDVGYLEENITKFTEVSKLETYSIGLEGSEDLKQARIVAEYLKTKHKEIIVTEQEMINAIPEVIWAIESYDTTTVRASIGNYLLGKYISENSEAKVIFNGDGSDELFGGYLYMKKCPDVVEFDCETRRLLKDIHLFDVLRSDKSISSHGLEPRTPFLDRELVSYYLSLPMELRVPVKKEDRSHGYLDREHTIEKHLLRQSFKNYKGFNRKSILPSEILWRKKEAFSDGVSGKSKPFYQVLQEYICRKTGVVIKSGDSEEALNAEKEYYKQIFYSYYTNPNFTIPYYWMPKYTNAKDPSARTLDVYNDEK